MSLLTARVPGRLVSRRPGTYCKFSCLESRDFWVKTRRETRLLKVLLEVDAIGARLLQYILQILVRKKLLENVHVYNRKNNFHKNMYSIVWMFYHSFMFRIFWVVLRIAEYAYITTGIYIFYSEMSRSPGTLIMSCLVSRDFENV